MLRLDDAEGRSWDVVVGRESWGALFAIFVPRDGGRVRQTILEAESTDQAHRELEAMDDAQLRELLDRSEVKDLG